MPLISRTAIGVLYRILQTGVGYSYGVPHCFEIGMKSCAWSGFWGRASIQSLARAYVAPFWPYGFI